MSLCPTCRKELVPPFDVCPDCGYTSRKGGAVSSAELSQQLSKYLCRIEEQPRPSVGEGFAPVAVFALPVVTALFVAMAVVAEAGMFWILSVAFAAWSAVVIVGKCRGTLKADEHKAAYKNVTDDIRCCIAVARKMDGNETDYTSVLDETERKLAVIESKHNAAARTVSISYIALFSVIILSLCYALYAICMLVYAQPTEAMAA